MSLDLAPPSARPPSPSTRLELFSDAVFAIVITLLAVEIHRPQFGPGQLQASLVEDVPAYLAYALGFLYVGVIWLNHHGVFRHVAHTDRGFNWINLGLLGTTTLMPFATGVLASAFVAGNRADQQTAVVLYALVASAMSLAWVPLFAYLARRPALWRADTPPGLFAAQRVRPWIGVGAFSAAAILGATLHPVAAITLFVAMLAYHAWTSDGLRRAAGRH